MSNCLSPSILSSDFGRLGEDIRVVDEAGADYIHVDVMDGKFVENDTIEIMRKYTSPRTDVISVQLTSTLLSVSGKQTAPISGGDKQINAW